MHLREVLVHFTQGQQQLQSGASDRIAHSGPPVQVRMIRIYLDPVQVHMIRIFLVPLQVHVIRIYLVKYILILLGH